MLEDLSIKDFALIDNANVEFNKGFTVLSGETGAGKSLLIGALSFLLGGKAGIEQIRTGQTEAVVSGTFWLGDTSKARKDFEDEPLNAAEWLHQHGISFEEDRVLLRRYVRNTGKSGAWIGNTPVTRADLADFCSFLVDIHGQHEHQLLMKIAEHRKYLDSYAGLNEEVKEFTEYYSQLVAKRKELDELNADDKDRAQKIDLLTFAVKEIEEAKLKKGEDKELEEEEIKLTSFEKLYSDVNEINALFDGESGGIIQVLKRMRSTVSHASGMDKNLESLDSRLESSFYELSDICDEFKKYEHSLVFDPERLVQVQERNTLIYNLKKKYASSVNGSVDEVIQFAVDAQNRLNTLTDSSKGKDALTAQIAQLEKVVYAKAKEISAKRKTASLKMSQGVEEVLGSLGMKGTKFSVSLTEKPGTAVDQKCGPYGMDDIEFLICSNPGSPMQPLAKIASGGELSRVMLALKTILSESDPVQTMIFDEIDTGIGGEVAVSVGSHLKNLAKNRQVLCITHLASIAVYADNQIKIEKGVSGSNTSTRVFPINGQERVSEIARMLSGDADSEQSLNHAKVMLEKFSSCGGN